MLFPRKYHLHSTCCFSMKLTMAHKRALKRILAIIKADLELSVCFKLDWKILGSIRCCKDERHWHSSFYLNKMFGLVEEPKRGVPGAVGTDRDQVLQVLKTRSQVSTTVLLQLIVGRSRVEILILIFKYLHLFLLLYNSKNKDLSRSEMRVS